MGPKNKSDCIAKVNFPLYTSCSYSDKHIIVAGGGGSAKTGIFNGFAIYEIGHDGVNWNSEEVLRYDTGDQVIMNSAIYNKGKKTFLVLGQDSDAQVYQVKMKLECESSDVENVSVDGVRRRKTQLENNNSKMKVRFDIQPIVRVKVDFCKTEPCLNVMQFSQNGKLLLTGGADGFVRIWEFPVMAKVSEIHAHEKDICDLDFSHNNKYVVTVAKTSECLIWDIKERKKAFTLKWPPTGPGNYHYKRCRFGKSEQNEIRLFTITNPVTRKEKRAYLQLYAGPDFGIRRVVEINDILSSLTVSHDGKYVAIGTMGSGDVNIYIAFSLQRLKHVPSAHRTFVTSLEFLPSISPRAETHEDMTLISMSVDNQLLLHHVDKPLTLPAWLVVVIIILVICGTFLICSLLGL